MYHVKTRGKGQVAIYDPGFDEGRLRRLEIESQIGSGLTGVLYVLDEPTVGLHMADVDKLISVLHRLVNAGHSVIVIEHDLDVIAEADWVIDLGPEGGNAGGRIVAAMTPEALVLLGTHTGVALRPVLARV